MVFRMIPAQQRVEIIIQFPASVLREITDFPDAHTSHFVVYGDKQVIKVIPHDIFRLFYSEMVNNPVGLYEPMLQQTVLFGCRGKYGIPVEQIPERGCHLVEHLVGKFFGNGDITGVKIPRHFNGDEWQIPRKDD